MTNKERMDNTTPLTLDRRKRILKTYFETSVDDISRLGKGGSDRLTKHLEDLGYFPPMFDLAFRLLLSEQRKAIK